MLIREATEADWPAVWPFFRRIVASGETYPYPLDLGEEEGRGWWLLPAPDRTVVAVDDEGGGAVLGSAKMNCNMSRAGNARHMASASFMVDPDHSGRGVGRALCEYVIAWARESGFRAIQFNAVVETNVRAVKLYESLGFRIVGTVPEGFRHPAHGLVGVHVMHLAL
ncbi:GNAT family N-acetyltransferase [Streptomyces sp. MJP52]|uniref:GNAT family N-acetyltransferase n=1 Tax=Streptomyces sp. MJP52 TaxID=2940555 RepID=UPI002476A5A8|nr:GNAT family N-acetyltransferase [Streptomyces sp. MJP52]MDH6226522.1 GNAT superfamily N-acetyltransferase [Streptomyces sp. MJP52]